MRAVGCRWGNSHSGGLSASRGGDIWARVSMGGFQHLDNVFVGCMFERGVLDFTMEQLGAGE